MCLEIDGSSLRVRQATVIQDLQQDIENGLMRLFDLVKKNH